MPSRGQGSLIKLNSQVKYLHKELQGDGNIKNKIKELKIILEIIFGQFWQIYSP